MTTSSKQQARRALSLLRDGDPQVIAEWHPTLNPEITLEDVTTKTDAPERWWLCPKGHPWQAHVRKRVRERPQQCPYCEGRTLLTGFNDVATLLPEHVVREWDDRRNGTTAREVRASHWPKVWWTCARGHSWEARIVERRRRGRGCPNCAGNVFTPGINDLRTTRPEVAAQWDDVANGAPMPDDISCKSKVSYWWRCAEGHSWHVRAMTRAQGSGCPDCAGQRLLRGVNDLATKCPEAVALWHPSLNGSLTPSDVTVRSRTVVWWLCVEGHTTEKMVGAFSSLRQQGFAGCSICSSNTIVAGLNDLATLNPELAAQWHPTKNKGLRPTEVSAHSGKTVWWVCSEGHETELSVANKSSGRPCGYCNGQRLLVGRNDLETLYPQLSLEWHPTLNSPLRPCDVFAKGDRRVWWVCPNGHEYQLNVVRRAYGDGCTECSQAGTSRIEQEFFDAFAKVLPLASHDVRVDVAWRKRKFCRIDFTGEVAGQPVAIEFDGGFHHARPESFARDQDKTKALLDAGWFVVRIRDGALPDLPMSHGRLFQARYARGGRGIIRPKQIALTVDTVMAELNRRLLPAATAA